MRENGILLYPEADKFEMTCGTLLSHLLCNSKDDASHVGDAYRTAVDGLGVALIATIKERHPDEALGSEARQKLNLTISVIKRISHSFRKRSYKRIHIWHG